MLNQHELGNATRGAKRIRAVGFFPRELGKLTAKVTVRRGLAINRTAQIEVIDDGARTQVEHLVYRTLDIGLGNVRRAEGLNHNGNWLRDADGISNLDLTTIGQISSHHVLRNPTCSVRSGTVDLRAVLARERAAAVT